MHPIKAYLLQHGIDVEDYAKKAKRSKSAIYEYLRGTRNPREGHYAQLSKATNGKVTVNDLIAFYSAKKTGGTHDDVC